ncbi:MAG TPA: NUDIX hydrolase [Cyclobacteriaceae bacterium]|jgi:8-oxo-dGTP pyrophosphatase MutT (NUDIX family)
MKKAVNPWKKISGSIVYENNWICVEDHKVINPSGNDGIYGKIHFKNVAVGIIPIDEENYTWLVGQYRYPLNQFSWEIPEGGGIIGGDYLEAAKRELKEETGLVAGNWKEIQRMHLSNSVSDEEAIIYLAENLTQEQAQLDETEYGLEVKRLPFSDVLSMVSTGEITDSISVAGILTVARLKRW